MISFLRKNPSYLGGLMVFVCGILWGTIGPFIRTLSECGSSVYLTSFLRMALGTAILAAFAIFRYGKHAFRIDRKTLLYCVPLGFIGMGVNCICYSISVETAGVSVAAVLFNIAPVATAIVSYFLFSERIGAVKALGLVVNIIGCTLAATGGNIDTSRLPVFGILCGLVSGLCYAICIIIGKLSESSVNATILSCYSDFFGAVFIFFFLDAHDFATMGDPAVMGVGFLYALIPTVIAYLLFYEGIARMKELAVVPILASMETVVAVLLGVSFYGDILRLPHFVGIILVLTSIVLMNIKFGHSKISN